MFDDIKVYNLPDKDGFDVSQSTCKNEMKKNRKLEKRYNNLAQNEMGTLKK